MCQSSPVSCVSSSSFLQNTNRMECAYVWLDTNQLQQMQELILQLLACYSALQIPPLHLDLFSTHAQCYTKTLEVLLILFVLYAVP